jgi:hypothetical protein
MTPIDYEQKHDARRSHFHQLFGAGSVAYGITGLLPYIVIPQLILMTAFERPWRMAGPLSASLILIGGVLLMIKPQWRTWGWLLRIGTTGSIALIIVNTIAPEMLSPNPMQFRLLHGVPGITKLVLPILLLVGTFKPFRFALEPDLAKAS